MVTFYCESCGSTEKKKQAERHIGFCGGSMSCINCRETFNSFGEIKGHTFCKEKKVHEMAKPHSCRNIKKKDFYGKIAEESVKLTSEESDLASNLFLFFLIWGLLNYFSCLLCGKEEVGSGFRAWSNEKIFTPINQYN